LPVAANVPLAASGISRRIAGTTAAAESGAVAAGSAVATNSTGASGAERMVRTIEAVGRRR
jgi:hypothetical protein